jgi:hypothetical protein
MLGTLVTQNLFYIQFKYITYFPELFRNSRHSKEAVKRFLSNVFRTLTLQETVKRSLFKELTRLHVTCNLKFGRLIVLWFDRVIGVRSSAGARDFSSILCVQTGSGAHPASSPMGTGGPLPGGKARPWRDADHSPKSSAEVVNE